MPASSQSQPTLIIEPIPKTPVFTTPAWSKTITPKVFANYLGRRMGH